MKNNPFNFFKYWKKHGLKATIKQWKYQFIMLETPEWQIQKEIIGYAGALAGGVWGIVFYLIQKRWPFMLLLSGLSLIFYTNFKAKLKQLQGLKDLKEKFKEIEKMEALNG